MSREKPRPWGESLGLAWKPDDSGRSRTGGEATRGDAPAGLSQPFEVDLSHPTPITKENGKMNTKSYVEHRDGGYWVKSTRVSLDSLVYGFREGQSAESLAQSFPVLTLEEVYGAIAYYLAHQEDVDANLEQHEQEALSLQKEWRRRDPMFYQKLAEARRQREAPLV